MAGGSLPPEITAFIAAVRAGIKPPGPVREDVRVRDAAQDDAESLAALADLSLSAATHLIVERTVRVADVPDGTGETASTEDGLRGFVAFDARPGVVHVTQLAGDREAVGRLLEEPVGFAEHEEMAVEAVVPASATTVTEAVEAFGFDPSGAGPEFEGEPTRRYRFEG
jgi:hypothetical protein